MLKRLLHLFPLKFKNKVKYAIYGMVKDKCSTEYYAQFGEDALIQTYFKIKAWNKSGNTEIIKQGFYVDIGAFDPSALSNTFWFYKNGWSGITVDATPGVKENFDKFRPNDINVHAAISNEEGFLKFYSWGNSGFNTLSEEEAGKAISLKKVTKPPDEIKVPSLKLSSLLAKYLPPGQRIDFISIDVEGKDKDVLESNDWIKYRPELVIVEEHLETIDKALTSEIYLFLKSKNYELIYWAQLSLIFKNLYPD